MSDLESKYSATRKMKKMKMNIRDTLPLPKRPSGSSFPSFTSSRRVSMRICARSMLLSTPIRKKLANRSSTNLS